MIKKLSYLLTFFTLLLLQSKAQVNPQLGSAEQSFPLISYVDAKAGMALGVGLSYSSGNGLLVNNIASNVGTGWSLEAGGMIVRIQNGEPDDQMEWTNNKFWEYLDQPSHPNVLRNYPNGYLYNPHVGKGCNVGLNYYPVFKRQALYKEMNIVASDMEQDKFVFSMNGRSGTFVIGKDLKVNIIGDSKIKASFSQSDMRAQGIRTRINQFVFITEDGMKYTFNEKSLTRICRYKYSWRNNATGQWQVVSGNPDDGAYAISRYWGYELPINERPYVVNSWFLKEVENTNTGQKIIYNYQTINNDIVSSKLVSHQRNLNAQIPFGRWWYQYLSNPINASNYSWNTTLLNKLKPGATTIFYSRSIVETKRITSINLPNSGVINFQYSPKQREDLLGEHALTKISYSIGGSTVRAYELEYGYFFKNTIKPYWQNFGGFEKKFSRLCLLGIKKIGNGLDDATEPPYKFSYYTGSTLSADDIVPAGNYLAQDHWGYYNGNNSSLNLSEDHDFLNNEKAEYVKAVLPKLKNAKNGYAKNGLLKQVQYPTGGTIDYIYEQIKPATNILPVGNEQLAGGVAVSKTIIHDGENHGKDIIKEYIYKNTQNISTHWGDETPTYHNFSVTEYNEKWFDKRFKYPGYIYPEMGSSIDWAKIVGKAMLSSALSFGINAVVSALVKHIYGQALGATIMAVVNVVVLVITIIKIIFEATRTYEFHRFILSNTNNNLINPLGSAYSSVEVRSNSPGGGYNGKSIFEFTSLQDIPAVTPVLEWPYVQSQRLLGWAYGLPKKVTIYDKDDKLVTASQSFYKQIAASYNNNNNINCNCATQNKRSITAFEWDEPEEAWFTWNQVHWMTPRPYFIKTGRTEETHTVSTSYVNGAANISSTTQVMTDPATLLQKGKIIERDENSLIVQLNYFPTDYTIPNSALEVLKQKNIIHLPVSTETWLMKLFPGQTPSFTLSLMSSTITEYKEYTFGTRQEIKPWRLYQLKSKTPISSTVIGTHNPAQLIRNSTYYKVQAEMRYDSDGNLIETESNNNISSVINDYSSRYVVASVTNAPNIDIAYTSFESNGTGNWSIPTSTITTESYTGKKGYQIGSNAISKTGLSATKTYTVTYWKKTNGTSAVLVNGQSGALLYEQGGWQLYKHTISNATTISVSGNQSTIDELRLYPSNALMSTYVYDEGVGKTAECDANNRLLFYEYDALGRMKLIRDQNKNIIKTYEYNFKQ